MKFVPLEPAAFIWTFLLVGLGLTFWGYLRSRSSPFLAKPALTWGRRALLVSLVAVALFGPSIPTEEQTVESNVEVVFVIDRTGSMAAEDGPEGAPRLAAVKEDVEQMVLSSPSRRFAVITWDSSARLELPVTTDASAVVSLADALHQEVTEFSTGSNIDRPIGEVRNLLESSATQNPHNSRYLVIMTDGEPTATKDSSLQWSDVKPLIDGGVVLGYGTEEGGKMKAFLAGGVKEDLYIEDDDGREAISKIDVEALEEVAADLGVPLLVNATSEEVEEIMETWDSKSAEQLGDADVTTYRNMSWIPAVVMLPLLFWEAASFGGLVARLRRSNAL